MRTRGKEKLIFFRIRRPERECAFVTQYEKRNLILMTWHYFKLKLSNRIAYHYMYLTLTFTNILFLGI